MPDSQARIRAVSFQQGTALVSCTQGCMCAADVSPCPAAAPKACMQPCQHITLAPARLVVAPSHFVPKSWDRALFMLTPCLLFELQSSLGDSGSVEATP